MPRTKTTPSGSRKQTATDVDQLLDRFEAAVMKADAATVHALTEQLWDRRSQVPEVLTQRLLAGQFAVPALGFEILEGFSGEGARTYLRRIAQARTAPDIVRFGAQRRAGWPQRGEKKRRLAFLDSLADPDGTLVVAVAQAVEHELPHGEILDEVLGYLAALPSERRQQLVSRLIDEVGEPVVVLFHALLHLNDPATQRLVLATLVRWRRPESIAPVGRLAATARRKEIKAEAITAGLRLGLRPVGREDRPEPSSLPPLHRVVLTCVDGDGGQAILIARSLGADRFVLASFFRNDDWGIKDTFGASQATDERVEYALAGFADSGLGLVEVDLAAARGALRRGLDANESTRHAVPSAFELWEPLVHDEYPPDSDETVTIPELDDAHYAARADLVRQSGRLIDHPWFDSWLLDHDQTLAAMSAAPPPTRRRLTHRQFRPLIAALVDPPLCARLRERLRRQAWLLEQVGESAWRDLALATAASLTSTSLAALAGHPFLRAMVERSVQNAMSVLYWY